MFGGGLGVTMELTLFRPSTATDFYHRRSQMPPASLITFQFRGNGGCLFALISCFLFPPCPISAFRFGCSVVVACTLICSVNFDFDSPENGDAEEGVRGDNSEHVEGGSCEDNDGRSKGFVL